MKKFLPTVEVMNEIVMARAQDGRLAA